MNEAIEFLEHIRQSAGLNTVEFTSLLPIDRTTYYAWKRGQKQPHPLFLKLCVARAKVLQRHIIDRRLPIVGAENPKHKMLLLSELLSSQKNNS